MAVKAKEYTIYGLMRPDTFMIFYVGMTSKNISQRLEGHMRDVNYPRKWGTTARATNIELSKAGLEPIVITLDRVTASDNRYSVDLECFWINHAWSTGSPIQNRRGLHRNDRPIYLGIIKRLHEAVESGLTYESYQTSEQIFAAKLVSFPHEIRRQIAEKVTHGDLKTG